MAHTVDGRLGPTSELHESTTQGIFFGAHFYAEGSMFEFISSEIPRHRVLQNVFFSLCDTSSGIL